MLLLVTLLVGSALAGPDPARLFAPEQPYARAAYIANPNPINSPSVSSTAREQAAILIEEYLARSNPSCLARAMCQFGARKAEKRFIIADIIDSIANPPTLQEAFTAALEFLRNTWETINEKLAELFNGEQASQVARILAARDVGEAMGYEACSKLFACDEDFFVEENIARSSCTSTGKVCPFVSIGCAFCGLYAPAACGSTCTFAALYCGTSAYACVAEANAAADTTDAPAF